MSSRFPVCKVTDLPAGTAKAFACGKEAVAVFNIDGRYFACSDACPHAGGPLHQGFVDGTSVVCPWHGWNFELDAEGETPKDGVIRYRVAVENDDIVVEIPA